MRKLLFGGLAAGMLVLIFIGALLPSVPLAGSNDKLLHFAEFFIFSLVLWLAVREFWPASQHILTIIIASLAAIASELVQLLSAVRTASMLDYLADIAGVLLAVIFIKAGGYLWTSSRRSF